MALSQLIYRRTVRLLVYPGKVLFARLNCWFNFLPSCWFSHNLFFGTTKVADDEKKGGRNLDSRYVVEAFQVARGRNCILVSSEQIGRFSFPIEHAEAYNRKTKDRCKIFISNLLTYVQ